MSAAQRRLLKIMSKIAKGDSACCVEVVPPTEDIEASTVVFDGTRYVPSCHCIVFGKEPQVVVVGAEKATNGRNEPSRQSSACVRHFALLDS